MARDKFSPSEDCLRREREATSLLKDISTARSIISDGLQRYKKEMLHARSKKQVDDLSVFDVLKKYSSRHDLQDAYGYDRISNSEYDRLCILWDARETYIDESCRFSERVSEMLQLALNGCGEDHWNALDDLFKMKQRCEEDIKRLEKAENDYKRHHNIGGYIMNEITNCINGRLAVGDLVLSTPDDDFGCLVGTVLSIALLNTPEHDTDNETDDVTVNFGFSRYSAHRIAEIEQTFSKLYCGKRQYEDIPLGEVIMRPDCLFRITDMDESRQKYLLSSEAAASNYCYREMRRVMLGKEQKAQAV